MAVDEIFFDRGARRSLGLLCLAWASRVGRGGIGIRPAHDMGPPDYRYRVAATGDGRSKKDNRAAVLGFVPLEMVWKDVVSFFESIWPQRRAIYVVRDVRM